MKYKTVDKMDSETKFKMKFVFDVIDHIAKHFPVIVYDERLGIQFDAALDKDENPILVIQMAQGFPFTIGNLMTGKLEKTEPKAIYTYLPIDDREKILELKQAEHFYKLYNGLVFNHMCNVKKEVTKVTELLKSKLAE